MNKIKKGILIVLFTLALWLCSNKVYAASASISASSTNVTVGTSVNVSVSVSQTETYSLKMIASGGSLSGNTNNADAFGSETNTTVLSGTFVATTPGTYTISFSGTVAGSDLSKKNVGSSVNITVVAASSNGNNGGGIINNGNTTSNGNTNNGTTTSGAKITSLGITPLEYDFNNYKVGAPTGTTYYAKVPNEVTSISIYANGATSGTGTKTLKEGTNKFTVSNGTYTYYINVTRATLDGEEPANKPDDEERDEDIDTVIGLKSLSIEGYEFDKDFIVMYLNIK